MAGTTFKQMQALSMAFVKINIHDTYTDKFQCGLILGADAKYLIVHLVPNIFYGQHDARIIVLPRNRIYFSPPTGYRHPEPMEQLESLDPKEDLFLTRLKEIYLSMYHEGQERGPDPTERELFDPINRVALQTFEELGEPVSVGSHPRLGYDTILDVSTRDGHEEELDDDDGWRDEEPLERFEAVRQYDSFTPEGAQMNISGAGSCPWSYKIHIERATPKIMIRYAGEFKFLNDRALEYYRAHADSPRYGSGIQRFRNTMNLYSHQSTEGTDSALSNIFLFRFRGKCGEPRTVPIVTNVDTGDYLYPIADFPGRAGSFISQDITSETLRRLTGYSLVAADNTLGAGSLVEYKIDTGRANIGAIATVQEVSSFNSDLLLVRLPDGSTEFVSHKHINIKCQENSPAAVIGDFSLT